MVIVNRIYVEFDEGACMEVILLDLIMASIHMIQHENPLDKQQYCGTTLIADKSSYYLLLMWFRIPFRFLCYGSRSSE